MATEQQVTVISQLAAGDLSAAQYLAMKSSGTANTVTTTTAITDVGIGLLQNDPAAAGRAASVAVAGVAKGMLGATVAAGARVAPMANGRLQTTVATQFPLGMALVGGANGDIVDILLVSQTVMA